jgi:PIN domain nuclease of toxin-antitoxin system
MRLLLDTCTLIWFFDGDARLSASLLQKLVDRANDVRMSDVSVLEVVIKHQLGKLPLPAPPSKLLPVLARKHQLDSMPITVEAIFGLEALPLLHRDPFDRLLIGQALAGDYTLVTPDPLIAQYKVPVFWE